MVTNEFRHDVGQVVNSANDALTMAGNVLNVNFPAHSKHETPVTSTQRSKIFQAIRRLLIVQGKKPDYQANCDEILNELNAEFSIECIEQLPAAKYKEALAYIDSLMSMCPGPCKLCNPAEKKLANWRKVSYFLLAMTCLLAVSLAISLSSAKKTEQIAHESTSEQCAYNGVEHSVGALVKMPDNQLRECAKGGVWARTALPQEPDKKSKRGA